MLTSGTTGVPKMVVHTLAGLTASFAAKPPDPSVVWATFYDIRRYGGLQIFLRAVLGGASLVLSSAGEPVADHLARLAEQGVTHVLGTPTHWRRALMSPAIKKISPRYVRLSGEIADQAILDGLRAAFPQAVVSHAFASTEAGVAFEVSDGLAGFPAAYVGETRDGVEMKVEDGSLRIRSPRTASRYVGGDRAARRQGRLCRHRRHGRAARRPLRLHRPPRRHHQYRRPEGSSRGDRGRHQPPSAGADVAGARPSAARSPARSWSPTWC